MEARTYPAWKDFDMPQRFVEAIRHTSNNSLIGFLTNDRVFRMENKINFQYECFKCGHSKVVTRQYEDYSSCEKCRSEFVHGIPFWKECRGSNKATSNLDVSRIVSQMTANFAKYFGKIDFDIAKIKWDNGAFVSKFVCGEEIVDVCPERSAAKAAILCPFLWDSDFNWRDGIKNDRGNDLHISHLLMQWGMM
jgi:ribosomal protein L37AE/L43A